jgi:hypothetical protein
MLYSWFLLQKERWAVASIGFSLARSQILKIALSTAVIINSILKLINSFDQALRSLVPGATAAQRQNPAETVETKLGVFTPS